MNVAIDLRDEVAAVARLLSHAGLVEGFGHVSARLARGGFLLSSTQPLLEADASSVLEVSADGCVVAGDHCPLEAPLHAAIYRTRRDVQAICRTHSRYAAAWACRGEPLPLLHGLGGLSGTVALYDSPQLVCDEAAARVAAGALGPADCLLLRANGAVCTGEDLGHAATRGWFLEERAEIATHTPAAPALAGLELTQRERHFDAERVRAWAWMCARFSGPQLTPTATNPTRRNG